MVESIERFLEDVELDILVTEKTGIPPKVDLLQYAILKRREKQNPHLNADREMEIAKHTRLALKAIQN